MTLDDAIKQVQSGDSNAFDHVMQHCHLRLYYFIAGKIPSEHEIDEIVHLTFVTAFERINEFDSTQDFMPWLRGIAQNHCRNTWRTRERQQRLRGNFLEAKIAESQLQLNAGSSDTGDSWMSALKECLSRLPSEERDLLDRRFVQQTPLAAISQAVGREAERVRHHLLRIRRRLRTCVETRLRGSEA